jgi:acetone carboxylase gamma subunit
MSKVDRALIEQLVEGRISRHDARTLLRMENKDSERFALYLEVLQARVPWPDRILLRISDHLYVVRRANDGARVVKCDCGQEFGDYRCNWKTAAQLRVKTTLPEFEAIYYPPAAAPEPGWNEIREFYCPGCYAQLAVEVVPPGYPFIFEVLPDLDRYYRDFLGLPLPDEDAGWYRDLTASRTAEWAATAAETSA